MADGVSQDTVVAQIYRLVDQLAELRREMATMAELGPERGEPILIETELLQATLSIDSALALVRSHRTIA